METLTVSMVNCFVVFVVEDGVGGRWAQRVVCLACFVIEGGVGKDGLRELASSSQASSSSASRRKAVS